MENTKDEMANSRVKLASIPLVHLPMMSDEEWNRLAYRNWLERNWFERRKANNE